MSNSFNISVKPEIAAAVVKIDANKAVIDSVKNDTGPIRNDVTAIHDTNLPAVKADTGPIRNDVTNIHDNILPAVKVDTGAIRNDMTDIHDTELPVVKANTLAIRNDMTDIHDTDLPLIAGIVGAIKTKTDTIPQKFRGHFTVTALNTTSASWVDVINITGQGSLIGLCILCNFAVDTVEASVLIDGVASVTIVHTGDTIPQVLVPAQHYAATYNFVKLTDPVGQLTSFNVEFDTNLRVYLKRSAGAGGIVSCGVQYSVLSV